MRNWQTGDLKRITGAYDDFSVYPNGIIDGFRSSYDGRFIVFASEATNLVPNDVNGVLDIFMYDNVTGETVRISETAAGGNLNGLSSKPEITYDGQYIVFKSEATNLVPNDTNGVADIFMYTVATGAVERISVASSGAQGNGLSKDPSLCENGRFVAFTTDATNLYPGDTNGQRDIVIRDTQRDETFVVTVNGNGKAHRAHLAHDCSQVAFATDGTNVVAGDNNGERDIFGANIVVPADFTLSTVGMTGDNAPGETLTLTYTLTNDGNQAATADFTAVLPTGMTYVPSSATGGATHAGGTVSWTGTINGESSKVVSFQVTIDAGLTDFTVLTIDADVTANGETTDLETAVAVNGIETFLPVALR